MGDGWISMGDREPEPYQYVRVRKASGSQGFGVFVGDGWMIQSEVIPEQFENDATDITHWKSVPDAAAGRELAWG